MKQINQRAAIVPNMKILQFVFCLVLFCVVSSLGANEKETSQEKAKSNSEENSYTQRVPSSSDSKKSPEELLIVFNEAVALHQSGLEQSDPRKLREAEQLYLVYLGSEPGTYAIANNLAKLYEELGQFDKASEYYEIAIECNDPRQRQYLENYAVFLDKTKSDWSGASKVYSRLLESYSLTSEQQVKLSKRYMEQGVDSYIGLLWELIDIGGSLDVALIALKTLEDQSNGSDASRMELLAISTAGLSAWVFSESEYGNSGLQAQLAALSGHAGISKGISEIIKLYKVTLDIQGQQKIGLSAMEDNCNTEFLCQQLAPYHFPWWSGLEPHTQDPERGMWPIDGFRAMIRSLGEQIAQFAIESEDQQRLSAVYVRYAESYLRLAANLQASDVDPSAVEVLVRFKLKTEADPDLEQVRAQYETKVENASVSVEREGAFEYHKTLAEYYIYLKNNGDTEAAKAALHQLQQARIQSNSLDGCADNKEGELPGEFCFTKEMEEMLSQACLEASVCNAPADPPPVPRTEYTGDDIRAGIGYSSETDLTGELFWNFLEDNDSAASFEGWKGDDSSGGLKLNYHWLADGVVSGEDSAGEPIYSDGKVRKLFVAWDQNVFSDGKVSFGGGSERDNRFWSLYGSKSVTGERETNQTINILTTTEEGFIDNHRYIQTDTLTTTTDYLAHPYEWGIGIKVGRYFEDSLMRVRGGFDYEDGHYSSYQLSGYASIDKRFVGSSQGLTFRAEVIRKHGDFETDKSDFRVSAFWSWDFGTNSRTAVQGDLRRVERIPTLSELPREDFTRMVGVQKTLPFSLSFAYNDYQLTDSGKQLLDEEIERLKGPDISGKILVTGHTCSRGTDQYNLTLSEKRAETVTEFLNERGVDASVICSVGRGESEPKFSNATEDSREQNRRVEVSFVINRAVTHDNIVGEGQPVIEWVHDEAPAEAAWIRRALRNPVRHKRTVDYYRYNRVTEQHETERELINEGPDAEKDDYAVEQDSTNNSLNVLANDSDPEYDNLKIIAVSNPAHGTATISGSTILYTPDPGYFGTDTFSYEIEDVYANEPHPPGESSTAQVTVLVERANRPPVAEDDDKEVVENSYDNEINVLSNDSDPDGDTISIIRVGEPMNGTVTYTGNFVYYTPNAEFVGEDYFEYTIEDGNGGEDTALVTVNVVSGNRPPKANDDWAEVWKNNRVTINVLENDYDPDGDEITIVDIIQDEHPMGAVIDNGDGTLTYIPMKGWFGGDEFQYTISDGELTSTATVTIDVKGIPR